ncbi:ABC transporter ATP-binding protein [Ulvibacterium sp.]|uniref:ABC transporter ATP-binding protein n=1 Tax=Ulvibacterium sp. TaxID=2665914 RepID=UPI0026364A90|nr:ABC transporter ATP-binding protein [Ulvibacterium sp.]
MDHQSKINNGNAHFTIPILYTRGLTIGYRTKHDVLELEKDLNIKIHNGELVCLIGPNGCGKSTLMRTIAGLQKPLEGDTVISEVDVKKIKPHQYARLLSLVLTDKINVGGMKVMDIVSIGRYPYTNYFAKLGPKDYEIIERSLDNVHLNEYKDRFFHELSDGEKQRVLIAKALAQDTPLIMLDEPTAHLDLPNRVEIMNILKRLAKETNKAIFLSTHELDLALQTADTIWLMNREENMKSGTPEDLVLSGMFEQVFKSNAFRFDKHSGAFKVVHPIKGKVSLLGNGVHSIWVRRALEREGYQVVKNPDVQPKVQYINNLWQLNSNGNTLYCQDIAGLLRALRKETPS